MHATEQAGSWIVYTACVVEEKGGDLKLAAEKANTKLHELVSKAVDSKQLLIQITHDVYL
ncbi:MAG: hypothetical protein DWQ07_12925 [Chloroflexi bacterium]|nr:MAG: hypothetical protein DWQ07_12925 [Chloroflexota bacterium]MBL1196943.1 hypothetical protein [Chloroflexota bacterium]NOH14239.1 hypothetical protein [Chloroflexota bacterium]